MIQRNIHVISITTCHVLTFACLFYSATSEHKDPADKLRDLRFTLNNTPKFLGP